MILWQKQASADWLAANELRLDEIGSCDLAVISRPGSARSLIQVICHNRSKAEKLVREFGGVARPLPSNWSEIAQAQKAHAPIRIGGRLEILSEPAHCRMAGSKTELVIPAAGAFGTGEHATTAMSLRLLEETTRNLPRGWRLFDAGTGTGILALAARHLGAGEVLGLDNDPRAVAHARGNARRNQITRARFVSADLLQWQAPMRYEVITANLFSELLIAALPVFRRALCARGRLILSGILRTQESAVVRAMHSAQFEVLRVRRRGKWIALLVRRTAQ